MPGANRVTCASWLGCRPDVLAFDLVGQGWGAALPNFCASEALLTAGKLPASVLSICVEVCSAALYFDDDPGVLISACLFGDESGRGGAREFSKWKRPGFWKTNGSRLQPKDRDLLRLQTQRRHVAEHPHATGSRGCRPACHHGARWRAGAVSARWRSEVAALVAHPGCRNKLLALREQLGLSERPTSAGLLRRCGTLGNLSSACRKPTSCCKPRWPIPRPAVIGGWRRCFFVGSVLMARLLEVE